MLFQDNEFDDEDDDDDGEEDDSDEFFAALFFFDEFKKFTLDKASGIIVLFETSSIR